MVESFYTGKVLSNPLVSSADTTWVGVGAGGICRTSGPLDSPGCLLFHEVEIRKSQQLAAQAFEATSVVRRQLLRIPG